MEELARDVGNRVLKRSALGAHVNEHLAEMLGIAKEEFVHYGRHVARLNVSYGIRTIFIVSFSPQKISKLFQVTGVNPKI